MGSGPTSNQRVFQTLDLLRGVAAIAVVMLHYKKLFMPVAAPNAGLVVDLFFMMSGFVIAHSYGNRLSNGMTVVEFMRIRMIRLFPLYLLGLALGALAAMASLLGNGSMGWTAENLAIHAVMNTFMLPVPTYEQSLKLFPLNHPMWSIFFEVIVNLAFALALPLLSTRRIFIICASCVPALCYYALTFGTLDLGVHWAEFGAGLVRTVFGFGIGVLIARLVVPAPPRASAGTVTVILLVLVAAVTLPLSGLAGALRDLACVLFVMPLLIWLAIQVEPPPSLVRLSALLGRTSYGVYILHVPVTVLFLSGSDRISKGALESAAPFSGILLAVFILWLAHVLDKYYDMPVRQWLRRGSAYFRDRAV